jgi:hypothetical protein
MIKANFLRDIDWSCGILSSDIAADAMPAGMSWRSSATSCQWAWWLMSLTQIEKNSPTIKLIEKKLQKRDDLQRWHNFVPVVQCFDKPDLNLAELAEPSALGITTDGSCLDGRGIRPSACRRLGLRAFRSTQDRHVRGLCWAVSRGQ